MTSIFKWFPFAPITIFKSASLVDQEIVAQPVINQQKLEEIKAQEIVAEAINNPEGVSSLVVLAADNKIIRADEKEELNIEEMSGLSINQPEQAKTSISFVLDDVIPSEKRKIVITSSQLESIFIQEYNSDIKEVLEASGLSAPYLVKNLWIPNTQSVHASIKLEHTNQSNFSNH